MIKDADCRWNALYYYRMMFQAPWAAPDADALIMDSDEAASRAIAPSSPGSKRGAFSTLTVIFILAAIYFVAGKLGLRLAFVNQSATAVWPPTGIALAALLLGGYRLWPGIWLGAFLVNLTTTGFALTSVGIASGNTMEAVLGAWLVTRFANGSHAFDRAIDVFRYILLAVGFAPVVSATCGVTSLVL